MVSLYSMLIEIADNKTIEDLQQKFSDCFSLLKLEFYRHPHHWYENSDEKEALPPHIMLDHIRKNHAHGFLEFFSHTKTGAFESELREKYGLHVQVLRKKYGVWQQTTGTDQLSLGEQQKIASLQTML